MLICITVKDAIPSDKTKNTVPPEMMSEKAKDL